MWCDFISLPLTDDHEDQVPGDRMLAVSAKFQFGEF